eukprot:scaffold426438_cov18-Prasinocladus_malaysianus.AAC.1
MDEFNDGTFGSAASSDYPGPRQCFTSALYHQRQIAHPCILKQLHGFDQARFLIAGHEGQPEPDIPKRLFQIMNIANI